ncbi:MAG: heavy metal-binding domain-containing protein, partial [Thermoanaerobaculia bacterium]
MKHAHSHSHTQTTLPIDPVCGMTVDPEHAAGTSELDGRTYYFCNPSCKKRFDANPAAFLGEAPASETVPAPPGTIYTCPMDPEVRQKGPGACPKCGMALEPETIAAPATRTEWTCPMHPEIVRDAPGSCPICGMALEPRT